ncbi:MAG: hypothetical protein ACFCU9_15220 [Cyanophyceae cyanobacterium]
MTDNSKVAWTNSPEPELTNRTDDHPTDDQLSDAELESIAGGRGWQKTRPKRPLYAPHPTEGIWISELGDTLSL